MRIIDFNVIFVLMALLFPAAAYAEQFDIESTVNDMSDQGLHFVRGTVLVLPQMEQTFREDFLNGSGRGLRGVDAPLFTEKQSPLIANFNVLATQMCVS